MLLSGDSEEEIRGNRLGKRQGSERAAQIYAASREVSALRIPRGGGPPVFKFLEEVTSAASNAQPVAKYERIFVQIRTSNF